MGTRIMPNRNIMVVSNLSETARLIDMPISAPEADLDLRIYRSSASQR